MVEDPSATERDESIASSAGMIFILIGCRASGSRLLRALKRGDP